MKKIDNLFFSLYLIKGNFIDWFYSLIEGIKFSRQRIHSPLQRYWESITTETQRGSDVALAKRLSLIHQKKDVGLKEIANQIDPVNKNKETKKIEDLLEDTFIERFKEKMELEDIEEIYLLNKISKAKKEAKNEKINS